MLVKSEKVLLFLVKEAEAVPAPPTLPTEEIEKLKIKLKAKVN